ncbi:phage morphogeneis protein [Citromicrobium sp. RCC1885]|uniref:hypothetical protein n=1 Tax=unclassified Citromicrobium TaxID=2630544 RepID=UPI0006C8F742|nr:MULTISPECIES: hypothetical protein [unclassified Citromicrobium]KPM23028.1 phage morphogeneis protein [Citromicrobium sp. RCC1885]KPM27170.1 phage morphogeneis protein [Citromicrobium sp. RCC1878]OAM09059.1 phage morphogenesis protein [Citromicrobium sp. RCC1897]
MAEQSLKWNGDALSAKMRRAQIAGVNGTMALCVQDAKANHPWQNQTGVLEGSYDIAEGAHPEGTGVAGTWGSQGVKYALAQELGATIVPVKAKALAIPQPDGSVRFVKRVVIPPRPALRPAADRNYPKLPEMIRRAFDADGEAAR